MRDFLEEIQDIRFVDPKDFFNRKNQIKEKYQELSKEKKEIYKWYFYFQLCLLKNPLKELFWSFLNQECDMFFMSNLVNEYYLYCNKRKKQSQIDNIE